MTTPDLDTPANRPHELLRPLWIISSLLGVAALYLSRDLTVPVVLAVLITFLLHPLVVRLRAWGLPKVVAVTATTAVAGAAAFGLAVLVATQLVDLTARLPDYRDNLKQKVHEVRSTGGGHFSRIFGTFTELREEFSATQAATLPTGAAGVEPQGPVKVEIVPGGPNFGELAATLAAPLVPPLTSASIAALLVIFLLMYADDFGERIVTLAGVRSVGLTTIAVSEAATRIGRYLRMQAVVNTSYGVLMAIGLAAFGVPNAMLWGVLGTILRFVPYIGPWVAAAAPTILTLAVFPGWTTAIAVMTMLAVIEFTTNMVLEPWLYSNSTGITSLGVVLGVVFWAWVWGPMGMVLAVPVTACLVVIGKHVPQFSWIHRLFGSDVERSRVTAFYQRLLAGDARAVAGVVKAEVAAGGFAAACDELLLPTLCELKSDAATGGVSPEQFTTALRALHTAVSSPPNPDRSPRLLCIAVQTDADTSAAEFLAHAARLAGVPSAVVTAETTMGEAAEFAGASGAAWVVLVQVAPVSRLHARRLATLLASKGPTARKIMSLDAYCEVQRPLATTAELPDDVRRFTSVRKLVSFIYELNIAVSRESAKVLAEVPTVASTTQPAL